MRFWMALGAIDGLGATACRKLCETFGDPRALFDRTPEELAEAGASPALVRAIREFTGWEAVDGEIARATNLGVDLVCLSDERYPVGLRNIADPPPVLYVRGAIERGDVEAIAVVGSRAASAYGLVAAAEIAGDLAAARVTVVSGLAVGIDAAAHRAALARGGRTIAVLGCGIEQVYPPRHEKLAEEITSAGAVVSEHPIGSPPLARHFPRRNRLVSGLSLGVVVVEASERSGSLITARLALEQGREVYAVPGEIGLARTRGTHRLIRRGARLVENGAQVIEDALPWRELRAAVAPAGAAHPLVSAEAARVLAAFDAAVEHVDRLIERSGLSASRVLETLLELELAGRVVQHPGKLFTRRSPATADTKR